MGANESTPRQVTFDNPNPAPSTQFMPIVITQSVMDRIEGRKAIEQFNQQNSEELQNTITTQSPVHPGNIFTPSTYPNSVNDRYVPTPSTTTNPEPSDKKETEIMTVEKSDNTKMNALQEKSDEKILDSMNVPLPQDAFLSTGPEVPKPPFPTSNAFNSECKTVKIGSSDEARKLDQIQKTSFVESFEQIDKILGRADRWHNEFGGFIKDQKEKLIQCYKSEQQRESFKCEQLAKDFQKHLLQMQYKTLNDPK